MACQDYKNVRSSEEPISARAFEILHIYWRGLEPNEKIPDRAINSALQPVLSGLRGKETADPPCDKQKLFLGSMAGSLGVCRSGHNFTTFMRDFFPLPLNLTDRVSFVYSCSASSEDDFKARGGFLTWGVYRAWGFITHMWRASNNVGAGTIPRECLL